MKIPTKKLTSLSVFILLLMLVGISPAFGLENDSVRVWVEYQSGYKADVAADIRGIGAQFHYDFNRLNSFVVSLPSKAAGRLAQNPHVVSIEADPVRSLVRTQRAESTQIVPYGIDMVQARDIWDANRNGKIDPRAPTGEGRAVCIIDTGFYAGHEDFAGIDLIGGYSQVDENWAEDGYGHGTHVAGTINAVNNELGVVGVSPGEVSLFIVKIFDNAGEWVSKAHASDLVAGIYHCADAGVNIISMSLSGTNSSGKERMAFDELYAQGILHVAAASNDGIDEYHYPASYDSVISVAAALIWSANPEWTNIDIREALDYTALDLGDFGRDVYYGFGLIQAHDALEYLQTNH